MFKSRERRRNFLIALIIVILLHLFILYWLFTYKPEHDFFMPDWYSDEDNIIFLPIIEESPAIIDEEEPELNDEPFKVDEKKENQQKPLYNPYSDKEADVMDGKSITQSTQKIDNPPPGQPATLDPSDHDESGGENEPVSAQAIEPETEEEPSEPSQEIQEELPDIEEPNQTEPNDLTEVEHAQFAHNDEEAEEEEGYQVQEEIIKEKDPNALRPIISQRSREKARAQLANFAQGFDRHYKQVQSNKKKPNTGAARAQQQQTELQTMSYRQKVDQAIKESAFYAKELYSDIDINHQIKIMLTIDQKGNVINIVFASKTASPTVNNFIKNVILAADFPPLPAHLNLNSWTHVWQPLIQVQRGKNSLRYQYS